MLYNSHNIIVSLTLDLAEFLRNKGYAIYWHSTGETDSSVQDPPVGTITFIASIPANPSPFVRLKSESGGLDEIVVPALSLRTAHTPRRRRILGIGHREYEWEQDIEVDAFALDEFEQRSLSDLIHDWANRNEYQELPVFDYSANATNPNVLEPVRVTYSDVRRDELDNENAAVRYHVRGDFTVQFVE
jgi:hypothetical protein